MPEPKLIVVANRLPVTISKNAKGEYTFKMSSGGLVSALSGCKKDINFVWIGWPGYEIPEEDQEYVNKRLMDEFSCQAVYVSDEIAEKHYNGFSNSILWPLFHYHHREMNFIEEDWQAYRHANFLFAEAVRAQLTGNEMVWVQDYHLMLVPMILRGLIEPEDKQTPALQAEMALLRAGLPSSIAAPPPSRIPGVIIGFFLHTSFPSSEIYRILPVRRELLLGVLHSDLLGFHIYDYQRHFLSSCTRVLGVSTMPNGVQVDGHYAHVGTYPIGIEPTQFINNLAKPKVVDRIAALKRRFDGVKVIVGVDRLDYIKGIPQKLHALEVFLTDHPEWAGKVVLVQLAIPSRGDVEEYQNLRSTIQEQVGRINGRFGSIEFMPVHFLHCSLDFDELCALYAVSDVCLIASTRDGMNLVSYEYIACQLARHGQLVLSEFCGASQSLNGAIICNPWNTAAMADCIRQAIEMKPETKAVNHAKLFSYISKHTASYWGKSFVDALRVVKGEAEGGEE